MNSDTSKIELMRNKSRWRRFIGQKTRKDKFYWGDLLKQPWLNWLSVVLKKNTFTFQELNTHKENSEVIRLKLRKFFNLAISSCNEKQIQKLEVVHCSEILTK